MPGDFTNSSAVAGGDTVLATQYNNLRKDTIINAGDYATSTGSANAYVLAIDGQITAYATGQIFKFKANFTNTGAATLNVNSIGAKSIKKKSGGSLIDVGAGDILSGEIVLCIYDGTYLQLFRVFSENKYGDGSDGALSGTTAVNLGSSAFVVKQYTSVTIASTDVLTFTNSHTNGTYIIFLVQGDGIITSSATRAIDLRLLGPAGGTAVSGTSNTNGNDGTQGKCGMFLTDSGKKGNATGALAGNGGALPTFQGVPTDSIYLWDDPFAWIAAGGGSGAISGNGSGTSATSGKGGKAAGSFKMLCGGALNFTGTIDATGEAGGNGVKVTSPPDPAGGGGGGGGRVRLIAKYIIASSGTINVTGGAGGTGTGTWGTQYGGGGGGNGRSAGVNGSAAIPGNGGAGADGDYIVAKERTV
jgi:hypothetical protein